MREFDLSNARRRKSSHSDGNGNGNGGSCVEVADGVPGVVPVRDSKVVAGPVLLIGSLARTEFIGSVAAASAVPRER